MAPPTKRRTGHSKKAQFSAFTGYLVAALGVLIGAGLLALSAWKPESMSSLRAEATDLAMPAGRAGAEVRSDSQGLIQAIAGYFDAGNKNARLKREMEEARVHLAEAKAIETENHRLKALLGLRNEEVKPIAFARLIGSSSASTRRFAYLSAGSSQGVQPGMPVRSPLGLVGRVLEVGDASARVMLLTDTASMVPVRRNTDNIVAFAEGRADGTLRLRLINLGINPLKKGDIFVTSGAGGIFRPGIAVAMVEKVTHDGAMALPLANPAATIHVAIDPVWVPQAAEIAAQPAPGGPQ
ncbi:MAG TPA: rod shape-determining protein MreC [Sphingomonadaceae bacterium]|nr:rod shape-determining protein MreC [Sphingomonadaceae bacterium]